MKGIGGYYYVRTADDHTYECRACGRFRIEDIKPLVGDRVRFDLPTQTSEGTIWEIETRRNTLERPPAANVDMLLIVIAPRQPKPDLALCDKLLLQARLQNIDPVLVVNKCDLRPKDAQMLAESFSGACPTFVISAGTGQGVETLQSTLLEKTICFAGQSAVGKSTLLNALCGDIQQTGGLSKKTQRGRHTTRSAELFYSPKTHGYVMDTPGFSVFAAPDIEPEDLGKHYPEFKPHLAQCRYPDCVHRDEPDCAVKAALERGEIDRGRYERYLEHLKEQENRTAW